MKRLFVIPVVVAAFGCAGWNPGLAAEQGASASTYVSARASATSSVSAIQARQMPQVLIRKAQLPQCVEKDQACTVGGTPCCNNLTCKGKFPNTTCR